MNIVVCIKQVPDAESVKWDHKTGTLIRDGVKSVINPFDYHAIEAALTLKDKLGAKVTAVTMGPPQAQDAIREAMSLGVDEGVVVSDRAFAGADTLATTYTLAQAIGKLDSVDAVFCGKQAIDGDTAQVGPGLAVRLGFPCVTYVGGMDIINDGKGLRLKRMTEQGYDIVEVEFPVVLTVLSCLNTPRVPSLKGKMRAKKAQIPMWSAEDIGAEPDKIGLAGSPTKVHSTYIPKFEAKREFLEGDPEEQAEALVQRLKEAGII
ncbi:MAG: electron transfer flavoprotein subunit beta/FixA family protein [Thermodesulfobacteria bacterium]|nr:electron transfer flavoprotein subunit beta/FixA family protein [Thermodesulfobacteriota bacterium]